jgi:hypothetical protein
MSVIITCDACHGTKETFDGKSYIKCVTCNSTGSVIFENFSYKVPSDFSQIITKIFNDRINSEITEILKLAKIDVKLKQDTNNYNKG